MVNVVLAGGGTAGHTSPLIATAQALLDHAGVDAVSCIGTPKGLEGRVIPEAGLELDIANFFTGETVQDSFGRHVVCRRGEGHCGDDAPPGRQR